MHIDPSRVQDHLTIRFRVRDVYQDRAVCLYFDDACVRRRKKRIMAPGEMEQIQIKADGLPKDLKAIRIAIEKASGGSR